MRTPRPPPPRKGQVWITRASPGAEATAARVTALGLDCIVEPLLTFHPIVADVRPRSGESLAFTSINGVTRAAALTDRRDNPVFAVGDATAEAARDAGFFDVASASGDVSALVRLILEAAPTAVLHLCALQTAGDLVGELSAAGVKARALPVYETVTAASLPAPVSAALERRALSVILLHSPKAAKAAAALLDDRKQALEVVSGLGLSPACVAPFRALPLRTLTSAPEPTEEALLRLLGDLAAGRPDG